MCVYVVRCKALEELGCVLTRERDESAVAEVRVSFTKIESTCRRRGTDERVMEGSVDLMAILSTAEAAGA